MLVPIRKVETEDVADAMKQVGRTEDIAFSPNGRRLALASFWRDAVLVLDVQVRECAGATEVHLSRPIALRSADFRLPHGVAFVGEDCLAVANRGGGVVLMRIPEEQNHGLVTVPDLVIRAKDDLSNDGPSSVAVVDAGCGLVEILFCANHTNTVWRYVLDRVPDDRVVSYEALLSAEVSFPDGVAVSPDGSVIAVSSHETNDVLLYRDDPFDLHDQTPPIARLRGVSSPHGIAFATNGEYLFAASAGRPVIHVFARGAGWDGDRDSFRVCEVLSSDVFMRGHYNDREGGPKGLAVHPLSGIVAITCEFQPLEFYTPAQLLGPPAATECRDTEPPSGHAAMAQARRIALRVLHLRNDHAAQTTRLSDGRDAALEEVEAAQTELRLQQAQLVEVRAELAELAGVRDELAELAGVRDELAELADVRDELAELAGVRDELAELAGVRAELAELAGVRAELAATTATLRDTLHSRTWRSTAPLRALADWVRRR